MKTSVPIQCVTGDAVGKQFAIAAKHVILAVSLTAIALAPKDELPSQASSPTERAPVHEVSMVCVDDQGEAVVGAEIHLFQYSGGNDRRYLHFGPFTSDERGRAVCPEVVVSNELGDFDRFLYARVPGRRVGIARSAKWKTKPPYNPDAEVKLRPSQSIEGRVTIPEGFDPTEVTIRVQTLHVLTGDGDSDYESFPRSDRFRGLDTALPEVFETTPDADGRIRFDDVPKRGRLYLVTKAAGLGEAQWRNEGTSFEDPITLTIGRESLLTGVVLSPDRRPADGMSITARLSVGGRRRNAYLSTFRAITDEEGNFAIGGLPQTEFVVSVEDPKKRWTFRPRENLLVLPENPRELTLRLEVGVQVTGRVLDTEGAPVEGAALSAIADSKNGPGLCHDITDATGRYQLHLPAGRARLYFNSLPDGFVYPDPQVVRELDIKDGQAKLENMDFTLQRQQ
jgi:hypothetical protein